MAIDNITEQCYKRKMDISTEKMSLDEKLHRIRVGFIVLACKLYTITI